MVYLFFFLVSQPRSIPKTLFIPLLIGALFLLIGLVNLLRGSFEIFLFFIPLKMVILTSYLAFFYMASRKGIQLSKKKLFLFGPLIISFFGYLSVNGLIWQFPWPYDQAKDPLRFGGVFGSDAVALGVFSGIIASFIMLSAENNKLKYLGLSLFFLLFASFASLSRTGVVIFVLILLYLFVTKNFRHPKSYLIFLSVLILVPFLLWAFDTYIPDRFSISLFVEHLFDADGGHVGSMYLKNIPLFLNQPSFADIFFGFDLTWIHPDSLYLFLLGTTGLLGIVISLVAISISYLTIDRRAKAFYKGALFMGLALSVKGNFILANSFLFMLVFSYYSFRQNVSLRIAS